jgi:hypothetical protein
MAFGKGKASAAELKARDLGLALARIAESEGLPASIGIEALRRANPRLTPLAIGQAVRREGATLDAALAERDLRMVDYRDEGPGSGMTFTIDAAA